MLLIGGDFFLRTYYIRTRFVPVKELRQRARYDLVLVHDKTACHTSFLTPVAFIHSLWSVVVNLQVRIVGMFTYRNVLLDRKSTRLNSSHVAISYAVFCLKKKRKTQKKYSISL